MCENEHHEWHVNLSGMLVYLGGDIVCLTNSKMVSANVNKPVMSDNMLYLYVWQGVHKPGFTSTVIINIFQIHLFFINSKN